MKKIILFIFCLVIILYNRKVIAVRLVSFIGPKFQLLEKKSNGSTQWFDDYFTITKIDPLTFAIGEPRNQKKNYSYLILGEEKGVLFDSGAGYRSLKPVVDSLTDLPITVIASHLHYDHIGSHNDFENIAFLDIPEITKRIKSDIFDISSKQHLGFFDGVDVKKLKVTKLLKDKEEIRLGNRVISLIHTPGHTRESLCLYDNKRKQLYSGDLIYPGLLYGILPSSSFNDYLNSLDKLKTVVSDKSKIYTAHGIRTKTVPILDYVDLSDLHLLLVNIKKNKAEGKGFYLKTFEANSKVQILLECFTNGHCL